MLLIKHTVFKKCAIRKKKRSSLLTGMPCIHPSSHSGTQGTLCGKSEARRLFLNQPQDTVD